jgi:hypothetical protein
LVLAVKHYGVKLFFVAALAVTLGLKLLFAHPELLYHGTLSTASELSVETVASFLLHHGFESRVEKNRFGNVFVQASAGKCRMMIVEADKRGSTSGTIELLAKPIGRLRYVFDGAVHEHQQSLASVIIDDYWARLSIKMGLSPSHQRMLAVAASDDCSINTLPWRELGSLS